MMKFLLIVVFVALQLTSQCISIKGRLSNYQNQPIRLFLFDGLEKIEADSSLIDKNGFFHITIPKGYRGIGNLEIPGQGNTDFVIDQDDDIRFRGKTITDYVNFRFVNSKENQILFKYIKHHQQNDGELITKKQSVNKRISKRPKKNHNSILIHQIENTVNKELDFVYNINKSYYISWYIPKIKFIHDMSVQARYNPSFIRFFIEDFRRLDLTDQRIINSGIYLDLIKSHFELIDILHRSSSQEADQQSNLSVCYIKKMLRGNNDNLLSQIEKYITNQFPYVNFSDIGNTLSETNS